MIKDSLSLVYPYLPDDTIGERLYKIRKRRKLMQKDLAAMINVRYQIIWQAETKNIISKENYDKLLNILGNDLLIT